MKKITLYSSKYGTSKRTAERLKKEGVVSSCIDLSANQSINIGDYSLIVLGGGIFMGRLTKELITFTKKNARDLKGKKVILYSHGLISEADYNDIITRSVGNQLKDSDFQSIYLGGELDVESLGFLNRAMLKQIAKENNLDPLHPNTLNEESYQKLTTMINDKI